MSAVAWTLFDTNEALCRAWEREFSDVPEVQVVNDDVVHVDPHDVLVTPGNRYGIMDGGFDLIVRNLLGVNVQDRVQWTSAQYYGGVIPIGCAVAVETGRAVFPWLLYAPTMTMPGPTPPGVPLLAFLGVLAHPALALPNVAAVPGAGVRVACPGLGSGTGRLAPEVVAAAMRQAWAFQHERVSAS